MNDDPPRLFSPNWIGVQIQDFDLNFAYYTQDFEIPASAIKPNWAHIGASAKQRLTMKCPGMMFELFGDSNPQYEQSWRPWIMTVEPEQLIGHIPGPQAATFCPAFGEGWEVIAPSGIRWAISKTTNPACVQDLWPPLVIGAELRVVDLEKQRDFYVDTFSLDPIQTGPDSVMLTQGANMPYLVFVRSEPPPPVHPYNPTLVPSNTKLSLSIQVTDIEIAAPIVIKSGATITTPVRPHEYGIDMNFLDPEGNPLQIVQYIPWP
jgi:predicted enzyme related to lactoylglutathione lyase